MPTFEERLRVRSNILGHNGVRVIKLPSRESRWLSLNNHDILSMHENTRKPVMQLARRIAPDGNGDTQTEPTNQKKKQRLPIAASAFRSAIFEQDGGIVLLAANHTSNSFFPKTTGLDVVSWRFQVVHSIPETAEEAIDFFKGKSAFHNSILNMVAPTTLADLGKAAVACVESIGEIGKTAPYVAPAFAMLHFAISTYGNVEANKSDLIALAKNWGRLSAHIEEDDLDLEVRKLAEEYFSKSPLGRARDAKDVADSLKTLRGRIQSAVNVKLVEGLASAEENLTNRLQTGAEQILAQLRNLERAVGEIITITGVVDAKVTGVQSSLRALERNVGEIITTTERVETKVDRVQNSVYTLQRTFEGAASQMVLTTERVETSLDGVQNSVDGVQNSIQALHRMIDGATGQKIPAKIVLGVLVIVALAVFHPQWHRELTCHLGESRRYGAGFCISENRASHVQTSLHSDVPTMHQKILACQSLDDFVALYNSAEFEQSIRALEVVQRGNDPENWAMDWAVKWRNGDKEAEKLDRDRRVCMSLLYALCDKCSDEDIIEFESSRRIIRIMRVCVVMNRAQALYGMTIGGETKPGMHWYAEEEEDILKNQSDEWKSTLSGYEEYGTINPRLKKLMSINALALRKNKSLVKWMRPEMTKFE